VERGEKRKEYKLRKIKRCKIIDKKDAKENKKTWYKGRSEYCKRRNKRKLFKQ
jgi:hypothetical protein